jgi:hypothetical protein
MTIYYWCSVTYHQGDVTNTDGFPFSCPVSKHVYPCLNGLGQDKEFELKMCVNYNDIQQNMFTPAIYGWLRFCPLHPKREGWFK